VSVADHYTYRVHWSAEDREFAGTVAELPSVSWLAEDRTEALAGVQRVVADIVAEMPASGEEPPRAIADGHWEVHLHLAIRAAERNRSQPCCQSDGWPPRCPCRGAGRFVERAGVVAARRPAAAQRGDPAAKMWPSPWRSGGGR
jgi:predicted RNase H-like HicB family nuclease